MNQGLGLRIDALLGINHLLAKRKIPAAFVAGISSQNVVLQCWSAKKVDWGKIDRDDNRIANLISGQAIVLNLKKKSSAVLFALPSFP